MVMQFLRCFGKVLHLDRSTKLPTLHMLQAGLLNLSPSVVQLQDLIIGLLSAVVCDPGFPAGSMVRNTHKPSLINVIQIKWCPHNHCPTPTVAKELMMFCVIILEPSHYIMEALKK